MLREVALKTRELLREVGLDVTLEKNSTRGRRSWILRRYAIDLVFDIGANQGVYGRELRKSGYSGRMVAFEPTTEAFSKLQEVSANDRLWECRNVAIGDEEGPMEINLAGNSVSSSFLPMSAQHIRSEPTSNYVRTEAVSVRRLDSIAHEIMTGGERVFLKLDIQGYEERALRGARCILDQVHAIEMELSLVKVYEDSPLFGEMMQVMRSHGFALASLAHGFTDRPTGQLLQVDGIFVRLNDEDAVC